jgi:hypothetical protein
VKNGAEIKTTATRPHGLSFAAAAALMLGLQAQFVAPIGGGLKLAASDPVAVAIAAWACIAYANGHRFMALPLRRLVLAFGAMAVALAAGAMVVAMTTGQVPVWAWAGRIMGLGLLAAYLVAGAFLLARAADAGDSARVVGVFVGIVAAATAVAMTPTVVFGLAGYWFGPGQPYEAFAGFVGNRNALSLILLAALALLFAWCRLRNVRSTTFVVALFLALYSLALLFAGSRAALPIAAAIILAALALRWLNWRAALLAGGAVLIYAAAVWLAARGWSPLGGTGGLFVIAPRPVGGHEDPSNVERWRSFGEAWRLFLSRPLTGIGLGAFADHQAATHGRALVVHNTALWILTEMGLVGALGFGLAAALLVAPMAAPTPDPDLTIVRRAILMFLVAAGAMSLVHEILYQRVIWVMLGLGLAAGSPRRGRAAAPSAER